MKFCAYTACLFFLIAALGNIVNKDMFDAFECVGMAWLSLWAVEKSA
jgi:hypothetical protein